MIIKIKDTVIISGILNYTLGRYHFGNYIIKIKGMPNIDLEDINPEFNQYLMAF